VRTSRRARCGATCRGGNHDPIMSARLSAADHKAPSYHSAAAAQSLASNSSASEVMAMPSTSIAGNGRFVFTPKLRIRSPTESALPLPVDSRFRGRHTICPKLHAKLPGA
jgi:hypothetical protein